MRKVARCPDYSMNPRVHYRSFTDPLSCVEGLRLTTIVRRAITHSAIYTNYLRWVEPRFNIQFTQFNRTNTGVVYEEP